MAKFKVTIDRKGLLPKLGKRDMNNIIKLGLMTAAKHWHLTYGASKFSTKAARKYNFTERKTKNIRTGQVKRTKSGKPRAPSGLPLVWSGRSRSLQRQYKVKGTHKVSSVTTPIRQFNRLGKGRNPHVNPKLDMVAEYKATRPVDVRDLARVAVKTVRDQLTKGKRHVRVVIG